MQHKVLIGGLAASLALLACDGDGAGRLPTSYDFVSVLPGLDVGVPRDGEPAYDGGGGAPGGEDALDVVREADIIQLDGDRLYALSAYSGLAIVDVADPDAMRVLGRYRASAIPFEMYLEGDRLFVMYRSFGSYAFDETLGYVYAVDSRLQSLDVSDPSNVVLAGEFALPGSIVDSRRIGDRLYVVTSETAGCWGCGTENGSVVSAFDISDLDAPRIVDEMRLDGAYTVASSSERLYLAGPALEGDHIGASIHVVDISDPGGALVRGETIVVTGAVASRWQMDEYDGHFRVISQSVAGSSWPPYLDVFRIDASDDFEPLASMEIVLPRPEMLRSARFDGPRAYAITFEQTDPLFTLDLSDPANPRQAGELEIPGWVYYMVPRGDRLLGLGYDEGNPEGSIHLSLFDVSDFDQPALIERVSFGGDWADFAEDQDRIHKSFGIFEAEGLLAVPYSGWDDTELCGRFQSGVQLVEFTDDSLTRRGVAAQDDRARRSFLHAGRLVAVSDGAIQSFDIDDRDAPVALSRVALSQNVTQAVAAGDYVARLSADWRSGGRGVLSIAERSAPDTLDPIASVPIDALLDDEDPAAATCNAYGPGQVRLFASERYLHLLYEEFGAAKGTTKLTTLDLADPTSPEPVDTLTLDFPLDGGAYFLDIARSRATSAVQVGEALVLHRTEGDYDVDDQWHSHATFEVIDLRNPAAPKLAASVARPEALTHGAPMAFGDLVVASHAVATGDAPNEVAFFLERLDVRDPSAPEALAPVNVPGTIAAYDAETGRAVTIESRVERAPTSESACYDDPHVYAYEDGRCVTVYQDLVLSEVGETTAVVLGRVDAEGDKVLRDVFGTGNLILAEVAEGYWGGVPVGGGGGVVVDSGDVAVGAPGTYTPPTAELVVLTGLQSGELAEASRVDLAFQGLRFDAAVVAGSTLLVPSDVAGMLMLDLADPAAPEMSTRDLYGGYCADVMLLDETAYCTLGEYGMQAFPLGD